MSLQERARLALEPPYAGWLYPWMNENLCSLEEDLERHLASGDPFSIEKQQDRLEETAGGFLALSMPAAAYACRHLKNSLGSADASSLLHRDYLLLNTLRDHLDLSIRGTWPSPVVLLDLLDVFSGAPEKLASFFRPPLEYLDAIKGRTLQPTERWRWIQEHLPRQNAHPDCENKDESESESESEAESKSCNALWKLIHDSEERTESPDLIRIFSLDTYWPPQVGGSRTAPHSPRTAKAVSLAFQETLNQIRDTLDLQQVGKGATSGETNNLQGLIPLLDQLEATAEALSLSCTKTDLKKSKHLLSSLIQSNNEVGGFHQTLSEIAEVLVHVEDFLDDRLVLGESLSEEMAPRHAKEILTQMAGLLLENTKTLIQETTEALKSGTALGHTVQPVIELLSGVLSFLGEKEMAEALGALNSSFPVGPDAVQTLSKIEALAATLTINAPHLGLAKPSGILPLATKPLLGDAADIILGPSTASFSPPEDILAPETTPTSQDMTEVVSAWARAPKTEQTFALRRFFLSMAGPNTGATGFVPEACSLVVDILNQTLGRMEPPSILVRAVLIQAHREILSFSESTDPEAGLVRRTSLLEKLKQANSSLNSTACVHEGWFTDWPVLDEIPREALLDFMAFRWPILTHPSHPDFWIAVRLLESALFMVGARRHAEALRSARAQSRLDQPTAELLSFLYDYYKKARPGFSPERLLHFLQGNLQTALDAFSKGDLGTLDQVLREQAQTLGEHGYMANFS